MNRSVSIVWLCAPATFGVLSFAPRQAWAAIHYVATTGSASNSGLSWASPKNDLQATISAAMSGDQVWVKTGTYTGNFTGANGVALYGGFAGTETAVSQRNIAAHPAILDGNSNGSVYTVPPASTNTATLDGFTIQHGTGTLTQYGSTEGGGVENEGSGILSPTNCLFLDNQAADGGAVNANGQATFVNCVFTNNSATHFGGGIFALNANVTLVGCTFTGDSAPVGDGGGVALENVTATITGCTFTNESCGGFGGGVFADGGTPTVMRCTFTGDSAGLPGGGIYAGGDAAVIDDCAFTGNRLQAVYLDDAGDVGGEHTQSLVKDNLIVGSGTSAADPDGIDVSVAGDSDTSYVTFANNTIANTNVGIDINSTSGMIAVANMVFFENGGGLNSTGGVPMTSSYNDDYGNIDYNDHGMIVRSNDLTVNPTFVGAASGDYHLTAGSALIDAGSDSYVAMGDTDRDGNARIQGFHVDLGAYEGGHSLAWTAVAAGAAGTGAGRILWDRSDGTSGLWAFGASDTETTIGAAYGPFSGWAAKALVVAGDGTSRVLWVNANGEAGVWTFNAAGTETAMGPAYGSFPGWTAQSIGVAGDGTARVLWTNTDGTMGVWSFGIGDAETLIGASYGPYSGWSAKSLATDADGISQVLWTNVNGDAGVWSFSASDAKTTIGPAYGPFSGWTATSIGATGDDTARVLWTNVNGDAGIWSFDASGVEATIGATYGPYPGWTASSLGVGADGTERVLWNRSDHAAGVWSFGATDAETVIGAVYGPF